MGSSSDAVDEQRDGDQGGPAAPKGERTAYLPPRAAVRARKLILRTQLGLPWMIAALVFAGVILVAGVLLLLQAGRPGAPWVLLGPLGDFPAGEVTQAPGRLEGSVVVVDRRGGTVRAFLADSGACAVRAGGDGFARPCTGDTWTAGGAPTGDTTTALEPVPVRFASGNVYVNPASG